jgi:GTP-binding protein EngB required for normal cell division
MAEDDERSESNALRAVGERLGGWARRVGSLVADVSGRPTIPEPLRAPLNEARQRRLDGQHDQALFLLREQQAEHPEDSFLRWAIGLCHVYDLLHGGRPIRPLAEIIGNLGETLGRGPVQVLRGAQKLYEGHPDHALDELRRASADMVRLPEVDEAEARFVLHLLAGLAHLRLGNEERALRELQKTRARTPADAGASLRALILRHGVSLSLAAGELADSEAWIREALTAAPDDRLALELLCRTLAAKGDRIGAHALLENLGDDRQLDETRLWVALTVGSPPESELDLRGLAMRYLQENAQDPEHRRTWALCELYRLRLDPELTIEADLGRQVVAALVEAAAVAPPATRDRYLQEVAHAALRLDELGEPGLSAITNRLERDEATAPEELRLFRARLALRRGESADADFVHDDPPRFRTDPDIGSPRGPDPRSPVRDADLRGAVLGSQRNLAGAEKSLARGEIDLAQDLLVDALVEWPGSRRAQSLLGGLGKLEGGARLEDLLSRATKLLAAVPNRVLGVSLHGVQQALSLVIAARERLARPLTIAIMGEFSAGKSTFVNALLGEPVAPMGVLPTTTTINVFRRGTAGGARIHYRDGRISVVAPEQVQMFLHGIDDVEASRIRHVEIERTGRRMGDAAVVDTPGLNALDGFHEHVAREFLDEADAVVWVFSATRSGAASEVGMLSELRASGRQVLGVLNKVDTLEQAEQAELADYLREQLGKVLVEVVPLRARAALEHRTAESVEGEDPFEAVESALEIHFLRRARELKRGLTARRLTEALGAARSATSSAIEALEQRATDARDAARGGRIGAQALLSRFADRVRDGVLDIDDVLTRESLSLGLLQTGEGLLKGPIDPLDAEYLGACIRDAALAGLQRALLEVAHVDATASEVLDRAYVPWARGFLEGLLGSEFVVSTLRAHGGRVATGEAAVRSAFRVGLEPTADAWAERARSLVHDVERARQRSDRHATSAPRAEAMRLRTATLSAIDGLRRAAEDVDP